MRCIGIRMLVIPVVLAIALFGWIANRGTTVADDLQAGDCLVMPTGADEFDRLDTEECLAPHDGHVSMRCQRTRSSTCSLGSRTAGKPETANRSAFSSLRADSTGPSSLADAVYVRAAPQLISMDPSLVNMAEMS
jgi:hypothetical protein